MGQKPWPDIDVESPDSIIDLSQEVDEDIFIQTVSKYGNAFESEETYIRWSFEPEIPAQPFPDGPPTPDVGHPAVLDGTVYIQVWFGPYDGGTQDTAFIAVDANTGERRWRIDTGGLTYRKFVPPTVTDDTILTSVPTGSGQNEEWMVTALDLDGTLRWQTWTEAPYPGSFPISDDRVYVPTTEGVRALDLAGGTTVWEALPEVAFESPTE